jgi:spore coat protein U-like protein
MNFGLKNRLFLAGFGLLAWGTSLAATPEGCPASSTSCAGDINVRAEVLGACSHLSTQDLDFGREIASLVDVPAETSIEVTCNNGQAFTVELDFGINAATSGNQRQVAAEDGSGNLLDYDLFQDAARTIPWNNTASSGALSGTGTGTPQVLPVYGLWRLTETATPGIYTDLVTVTLNF